MFTQEYIEEPDIERGQSDTISVKEELRECFGEIGEMYMDGKKTSGSVSQVSMPTQANVGDGMQSSSVLRRLQWSLTDSSEIMRLVVDNPVGVQRETVEMKTVGAQTDENEDACARPVMMAPLRLSTEIPDEAAWGTLTPTTGQRLQSEECLTGQEQIHQKVAHQAAKGRFGWARQCSHITRTAHWRLSASALLWGMKLVTMKTSQ